MAVCFPIGGGLVQIILGECIRFKKLGFPFISLQASTTQTTPASNFQLPPSRLVAVRRVSDRRCHIAAGQPTATGAAEHQAQQAEDRAHRHGQKRQVNVYIFCAKDTSDELQWQQLNRSLLRVSSTVNGKCGTVHEIKVDGVSYFETTRDTSETSNESMNSQNSCVDHESWVPKVSCDSHVRMNKGRTEQYASEKTLNGDANVNKDDEVSQHTGRIHLNYCTPETNSRPTPLFKSYRPEEVESRSIAEENEKPVEDDSLYMEGLAVFICEWKELRAIEKRRLMNKSLQLPLSNELCYLNEGLNHENGGLLKGGSIRRKTLVTEISHPLPSNATWRQVGLCCGHSQKVKLYTQAWSDMDEPLCKLCQAPCMGFSKLNMAFAQLNCHQLVKHLKVLSLEKREAPNISRRANYLQSLLMTLQKAMLGMQTTSYLCIKGEKCDLEVQRDKLDDELLIEIPGSA